MNQIYLNPSFLGFTCNWCSYRAADSAGLAREISTQYPPDPPDVLRPAGSQFVIKGFAEGADGVLVTGCHPGDCHYVEQNYKTMRRFKLLQRTLDQMGVEPGRIKLVWASAAEGMILAKEIENFVEEVRALGPLNWPKWNKRDGSR